MNLKLYNLRHEDGGEVQNESGQILTSGGSGGSNFTDLLDTPNSIGTSGQVIQVNTAGNALEFATPSTTFSNISVDTINFATTGTTWSLEQTTVTAIVSGNYQGFVLSDGSYSVRWVLDNRLNMIYSVGMRMVSTGDISITTGGGQNLYLFCNQCRSTGSFIYTSDDNLKSYEEPLISATETLLKLKPKKYKKHSDLYTSEESPDLSGVNWHYEAGFVAQDIETIPELEYLVSEHEVNNHNVKSICYNDLITYLVKGFQEQQAEINLLKQEIDRLKS